MTISVANNEQRVMNWIHHETVVALDPFAVFLVDAHCEIGLVR